MIKVPKKYLVQVIKEELAILENSQPDYWDKAIIYNNADTGEIIYIDNSIIYWLAEENKSDFYKEIASVVSKGEALLNFFKQQETKGGRIDPSKIKRRYIQMTADDVSFQSDQYSSIYKKPIKDFVSQFELKKKKKFLGLF